MCDQDDHFSDISHLRYYNTDLSVLMKKDGRYTNLSNILIEIQYILLHSIATIPTGP